MRRLVPFLALSVALHFAALFSLLHGVQIPEPIRLWTAEVQLGALPKEETERETPPRKPTAPPKPPTSEDRVRTRARPKIETPPQSPIPTTRGETPAESPKEVPPSADATASSLSEAGEAPSGPQETAHLLPGASPQAGRPDFDPAALDRFWAEVRSRIARNQKYPLWARRNNIEGVVVVRFALTREGRVQKAEVEKSSGHSVLDEAALEAVLQGDPYPPAPEGVSAGQLVGKVPIRFSLQSEP